MVTWLSVIVLPSIRAKNIFHQFQLIGFLSLASVQLSRLLQLSSMIQIVKEVKDPGGPAFMNRIIDLISVVRIIKVIDGDTPHSVSR